MSLSREQAQALAHLCHLLRPAWQTEGIMAALSRCRDQNSFDVTLATIRAAADPKAENPGVIPSRGRHWNEYTPVELSPPRRMPATRAEGCSICGKRDDEQHPKDHEFKPWQLTKQGRVPPPGDLVRQAIYDANGDCCACGVLAIHCPNGHKPEVEPMKESA